MFEANVMAMDLFLLPVERLIHRSDVAMVGVWRCPPESPWFRDSGPIRNHAFVFPRTALRITRAGGEAVLTDTGLVTLYNRGDEYRREALCDRGDECDWFVVASELLAEAVDGIPGASDPERPFPRSFAFSSNGLYFRQRRLVRALQSGEAVDPVQVDEAVLDLLDGLVVGSLRAPGPNLAERHVRLATRARRIVAKRFRERLSLAQLAAACGVSPWFLARIFRRVTGTTLHAYRERLRLRASLEDIVAGNDLSAVALDLGYVSHSHFTASFRRAFGATPSEFRRD